MRAPPLRVGLGEAAGAVADLGVFVPLAAALVLVNGLDPGAVFALAGALVVASGLVFGIPFPVQPLKALTAVAVAQQLDADVVRAGGLLVGVVLLFLSVRGVAETLSRWFTPTVVRALQFAVGVLLVLAAVRLVVAPPPLFRGTPPSPWPVVLAGAVALLVTVAGRRGRPAVAVAVVAAGLVAALAVGGGVGAAPDFRLPVLDVPGLEAFGPAFLLLVLPQIPLTFGNAVVAVSDVAQRSFGPAAARVRPAAVCRSAGVGNVVAALFGGMPMCHGSGGLTAHYALGARTAGMNLLLGGGLLVLGLAFAPHVTALLGLLPVWGLAAFLAVAGVRHALLVRGLPRRRTVVAVVAGLVGALAGNLALTAVLALLVEHAVRPAWRRLGLRAEA